MTITHIRIIDGVHRQETVMYNGKCVANIVIPGKAPAADREEQYKREMVSKRRRAESIALDAIERRGPLFVMH